MLTGVSAPTERKDCDEKADPSKIVALKERYHACVEVVVLQSMQRKRGSGQGCPCLMAGQLCGTLCFCQRSLSNNHPGAVITSLLKTYQNYHGADVDDDLVMYKLVIFGIAQQNWLMCHRGKCSCFQSKRSWVQMLPWLLTHCPEALD